VNKSITRALSFSAIVACLFATSFATVAISKEKPPESWDGLERRKVKGLDNVYVRPNVEFAPYKSVQLDPVQIEFSKDWQKNSGSGSSLPFSRRPTVEDMQRIRDGLAELMQEVFTEELVKHGYTLVDTPTEDTLHVRTAIIDLYVNAPDKSDPGITLTYTTSSGYMTLVLEARDGPTGQLLARVVDGRSDESPGGTFQWTNRAKNTQAARQLLQVWA
jgi:hypothetical protein